MTGVSGKPISIEPLATSINIDQRIHEKSNRSLAGNEGARENVEIFVNVVAPCAN